MSLDAVVHAIVAELRDGSPSPPPQICERKSSFDRPSTPRKVSPSSTSSRSTHSSTPSRTSTPTQQRRRRRTPPSSTPRVVDAEVTIQKARDLFKTPSPPSISSTRSSSSHTSSLDVIDSKELRVEVTSIPIECLSPCTIQWSKPLSTQDTKEHGNSAVNLAKKIRKILNLSAKKDEVFDEKDEKWDTGSVRRYRI